MMRKLLLVNATFSVILDISSPSMSPDRSTSLAFLNIHKDLTDNTNFADNGNSFIASHEE